MSYLTIFTKRCQQKFFIHLISITYRYILTAQKMYKNARHGGKTKGRLLQEWIKRREPLNRI